MPGENRSKDLDFATLVEQFSGLAVKVLGFIAGAVGLLYAIGFAVVNISLLRHGVYEVALVRARYVSAGVSYLLLFALLSGASLASLVCVKRLIKARKWRPRLTIPLSVVTIGIICYLLAVAVWGFRFRWPFTLIPYFFSGSLVPLMFSSSLFTFPLTSIFGGLFMLSTSFMIWCLGVSAFALAVALRAQIPWLRDPLPSVGTGAREGDSEAESKPASLVASFASWSIVGLPLLLLVYYYGHSAYATFPLALGGGLPIVVRFAGDAESLTALEKLGISLEEPGLTKTVELIAQTDTKYIVLVKDGEGYGAVSFEKSFTHGIRYYPQEYLSEKYAADEFTQRGHAYIEQGEPDKAIKMFDSALWRVPDYTLAVIGKGDSYLILKRYKAAIRTYSLAVRYEASAQAYYRLAQAYALSGESGTAVEYLGLSIEADAAYQETAKTEEDFDSIKLNDEFVDLVFQGPENAAIWYGQAGDGYREVENWEGAEAEYTRAISITQQINDEAGEARYHYLMAGVYLEQDKNSEALAECQEAVDLVPDNATYHFCMAEAHIAQEDFESARESYTKAREFNSDFVAAWIGEGGAYLALKQNYEAAVDSFSKAIGIDPNNSEAYYGRARAQARLDKSPEAVQDLRRAIILNPDYVKNAKSEPDFENIPEVIEPVLSAAEHNQTGNLRAGEGKLEEAIDEYKQALKLDFNNALYHANLGDVYRQLEQLGDAEEQYQFAIIYAPENDSYHHRLAGIYYDQGRFDPAIKEYEAAIAINDQKPVYFSGLGDTHRQVDSLGQAVEAYQRAIELDITNASYHASLADVYHRQGKLEDAVDAYSKAINQDDANPTYHYGLAQVYLAQEKLQEAIQAFQAAIERNRDYGAAYCGLGLAYQKSQQQQDAVNALRQCLAISQDEESRMQAEKALQELGAQ